MLASILLLAQADVREDLLHAQRKGLLGLDLTDTVLVLGAILLLAAALFSWAFFVRKRPAEQNGQRIVISPRRRRHHRGESADEAEPAKRLRVRRRRRRHPDNLPRNPTLAEAGGLPPVRSEEPEPPPAAPL